MHTFKTSKRKQQQQQKTTCKNTIQCAIFKLGNFLYYFFKDFFFSEVSLTDRFACR